jgi:hypothetical protein
MDDYGEGDFGFGEDGASEGGGFLKKIGKIFERGEKTRVDEYSVSYYETKREARQDYLDGASELAGQSVDFLEKMSRFFLDSEGEREKVYCYKQG